MIKKCEDIQVEELLNEVEIVRKLDQFYNFFFIIFFL